MAPDSKSAKQAQAGKKHGGPAKTLSASQVLKTLSQAAKKARTFESQKIIRKLKKLKEEEGDHGSEIQDMEAQLEAVKNTDLSAAAGASLKSYCTKHDIALPADLDLQSAKAIDTATPQGKALNRILANKHLHEAVTSSAPKLAPGGPAAAGLLNAPQAPVAGSSKEVKSASAENNKKQKKAAPESNKGSNSSSQAAKPPPAGTSTFLPSLSAGFTFGDSDNEDDYSLSEGEDQDPSAPQRKNRRGQRARRAIWEKKFGKNAKHLQKSAHAEKLAKAAVDAKQASRSKKRRGSEAEERQPYPPRGGAAPQQQSDFRDSKRPRRDQPNTPQQQPHHQQRQAQEQDEANMHPSWKARKAAAEKASIGVNGGGFSGTKITFDD